MLEDLHIGLFENDRTPLNLMIMHHMFFFLIGSIHKAIFGVYIIFNNIYLNGAPMIFNYCYSVSVLFADPGVFHQTPARVSPLGTEFGTRKAWLNWARLEAPKACFLELARRTSEAYVPASL